MVNRMTIERGLTGPRGRKTLEKLPEVLFLPLPNIYPD
jgi:hypothetical protein